MLCEESSRFRLPGRYSPGRSGVSDLDLDLDLLNLVDLDDLYDVRLVDIDLDLFDVRLLLVSSDKDLDLDLFSSPRCLLPLELDLDLVCRSLNLLLLLTCEECSEPEGYRCLDDLYRTCPSLSSNSVRF